MILLEPRLLQPCFHVAGKRKRSLFGRDAFRRIAGSCGRVLRGPARRWRQFAGTQGGISAATQTSLDLVQTNTGFWEVHGGWVFKFICRFTNHGGFSKSQRGNSLARGVRPTALLWVSYARPCSRYSQATIPPPSPPPLEFHRWRGPQTCQPSAQREGWQQHIYIYIYTYIYIYIYTSLSLYIYIYI